MSAAEAGVTMATAVSATVTANANARAAMRPIVPVLKTMDLLHPDCSRPSSTTLSASPHIAPAVRKIFPLKFGGWRHFCPLVGQNFHWTKFRRWADVTSVISLAADAESETDPHRRGRAAPRPLRAS